MSGVLYHLKFSVNMKYNLVIRDAYNAFERTYDDAIYKHTLSKNPQEFWKAWHTKFFKKITSQVHFPNCKSDVDIASKVAKHFNQVYNSADSIIIIIIIIMFICQ
jgi:hypothetical protein